MAASEKAGLPKASKSTLNTDNKNLGPNEVHVSPNTVQPKPSPSSGALLHGYTQSDTMMLIGCAYAMCLSGLVVVSHP